MMPIIAIHFPEYPQGALLIFLKAKAPKVRAAMAGRKKYEKGGTTARIPNTAEVKANIWVDPFLANF